MTSFVGLYWSLLYEDPESSTFVSTAQHGDDYVAGRLQSGNTPDTINQAINCFITDVWEKGG